MKKGRKRNAVKCAARNGMTKEEVVAAVFERDKSRCTKCGVTNDEHVLKTGRSLEVHRIEPGKMYRVEICVLLCRKCHGPEPKRSHGTRDEEGSNLFAVVLPPAYGEIFRRLKEKTDRPIAAMIRRAADAYLRENGEEPPK